jgi:predicted transcriptional regulator
MLSPTEQKALQLLSSPAITQAQVAAALGVTESAISQMVSKEEFKLSLERERLKVLHTQAAIDTSYNEIEEKLLEKLRGSVDMMVRPLEIVKALSVVNGAKRRGSDAPPVGNSAATAVTLTLPIQIINQFTTNSQNQVVAVGAQDLVTMQSAALAQKVGELSSEPLTAITHTLAKETAPARQRPSKEAARESLISPDNY